jgi:hypothetical protein
VARKYVFNPPKIRLRFGFILPPNHLNHCTCSFVSYLQSEQNPPEQRHQRPAATTSISKRWRPPPHPASGTEPQWTETCPPQCFRSSTILPWLMAPLYLRALACPLDAEQRRSPSPLASHRQESGTAGKRAPTPGQRRLDCAASPGRRHEVVAPCSPGAMRMLTEVHHIHIELRLHGVCKARFQAEAFGVSLSHGGMAV